MVKTCLRVDVTLVRVAFFVESFTAGSGQDTDVTMSDICKNASQR